MAAAPIPAPTLPKKKLIRRATPDRSQLIRHSVQGAFILLNAWLGLQFFLWVRYFERGGSGFYVDRPAGVEGWLPIAGLMNFKYFLSTGHIPVIHPAALLLFAAFVLMSLFLKKAFCSWLCPVGAFSEFLWHLGRRLFTRNLRLPIWLDMPLRSLKYLLLAFFVFIIGSMSAQELSSFLQSPYGLLADVKMLNFFRDISLTAGVVLVFLVVLSLVVQNFWCRYLCPYGALMGLVSFLSPVKIRRDAEACIDCAKCARACPAGLAVDHLVQIRSVECTGCMECIAACPAQDALAFALSPLKQTTPAARWRHRALPSGAVAALVLAIFLGFSLAGHLTGHWQTNLPRQVYLELIPITNSLAHPGM
jgi:polyferredoxin